MSFQRRILTMLASFLFLVMMMGCDAPGSVRASDSAAAAAYEESAAPINLANGEPTGENTEKAASGVSPDGSFGGTAEIDDPFAAIGPALGFQSYSSSCDPFEDTYGTCL